MGEVYAATHRNGSRVAIKILHPHLASNPNLRSRFLQEGYAANAVEHPGVVRVLDDDTTPDGLPFLVMELLEGEALDVHVERRGGRLPLEDALHIIDGLLDVLMVAHQKQVLHRDLKPDNVFRSPRGDLKILDFGLAKLWAGAEAAPSPKTMLGRFMGTPGYMPPEQACGNWNKVDETSDLWSLSATLHFCLTGKAIHDEEDPQRTLLLTTTSPAPSIRAFSPELPPAVVAFVDRGLSFERKGRWQSAQEMKQALQQLRTSVGAPRPPSRPEPPGSSPRPSSGVHGPLRPLSRPASRFGEGSEALSPVEIAPDTYWVGKRDPSSIFHSNPYLRVFRDSKSPGQRFAMLIDPGSSSDFAVVHSKVSAVLGPSSQLSALFINHQDPDVGSSAPVLCARYAPQAKVLCSEATWRLIMHFGLPRERFVDTDKYPSGFRLPTGHLAIPVPSPFCHFRGAVMLYDPATRVLFSGDLFGGLTAEGAQGLWADQSDWSGLRAFHQTYMPSNRAIAPIIRKIRALDPPVEIIAPQHGRLLRGDILHRFLEHLEHLPVGLDLLEEEQSPDLLIAWNSVLHRVLSTAEALLGPEVQEHLLACDALQGVLIAEQGRLSLQSMGRWAVSTVVNVLTAGQPPSVSNPIKIEAMTAAEQFDLPSPDLHIDDAEGSESLIEIDVE
ncbi:MAG: protein kinase [Polyangiaceae bacterium]|jgi:serine/threonine-protein kinase|nr:protein kinase [Polyangiaceae bacterium]